MRLCQASDISRSVEGRRLLNEEFIKCLLGDIVMNVSAACGRWQPRLPVEELNVRVTFDPNEGELVMGALQRYKDVQHGFLAASRYPFQTYPCRTPNAEFDPEGNVILYVAVPLTPEERLVDVKSLLQGMNDVRDVENSAIKDLYEKTKKCFVREKIHELIEHKKLQGEQIPEKFANLAVSTGEKDKGKKENAGNGAGLEHGDELESVDTQLEGLSNEEKEKILKETESELTETFEKWEEINRTCTSFADDIKKRESSDFRKAYRIRQYVVNMTGIVQHIHQDMEANKGKHEDSKFYCERIYKFSTLEKYGQAFRSDLPCSDEIWVESQHVAYSPLQPNAVYSAKLGLLNVPQTFREWALELICRCPKRIIEQLKTNFFKDKPSILNALTQFRMDLNHFAVQGFLEDIAKHEGPILKQRAGQAAAFRKQQIMRQHRLSKIPLAQREAAAAKLPPLVEPEPFTADDLLLIPWKACEKSVVKTDQSKPLSPSAMQVLQLQSSLTDLSIQKKLADESLKREKKDPDEKEK